MQNKCKIFKFAFLFYLPIWDEKHQNCLLVYLIITCKMRKIFLSRERKSKFFHKLDLESHGVVCKQIWASTRPKIIDNLSSEDTSVQLNHFQLCGILLWFAKICHTLSHVQQSNSTLIDYLINFKLPTFVCGLLCSGEWSDLPIKVDEFTISHVRKFLAFILHHPFDRRKSIMGFALGCRGLNMSERKIIS